MTKLNFSKILTEVNRLAEDRKPSEASVEAHRRGLVYGGHTLWIDPKTRKQKGKTVKGKFVPVGEGDVESEEQNKGRLVIVDFDDSLLDTDVGKKDKRSALYINMIKGLATQGGDLIVMCGRGREEVEAVARFFADIGVVNGVKVAPVGHTDPNRKKEFVKRKIKSGYKDIAYFDDSEKNIAAIESLRATFNRAQITLVTHLIPAIKPEVEKEFDKKPDRMPR